MIHNRPIGIALAAMVALALISAPAASATTDGARPYDQKLMRLGEILGAMHYLRELCGANDGQKWRDHMRELVRSEGTNALRRATIARQFNHGYRGYSRTYRTCTEPARTTISRFLSEAIELSDDLLKLAR